MIFTKKKKIVHLEKCLRGEMLLTLKDELCILANFSFLLIKMYVCVLLLFLLANDKLFDVNRRIFFGKIKFVNT